MKLKNILLIIVITLTNCIAALSADVRYSGGDISLLPTYQAKGSRYYDLNGKQIDFINYSSEVGMNAMRVRLFVDPDNFNSSFSKMYDANVCQDLEYILPLCQQIKASGLKLMLDFHYSDTWADPVKQYTPESWKSLSDSELIAQIYEYTQFVLQTLKDNGATPDFIQPGNEISYGMMWGPYGASNSVLNANKVNMSETSDAPWIRLTNLLKSAITACKETCPEAEIVIHTETVAKTDKMTKFYDKMKSLGVEYDIIGISYYPYFHGPLSYLERALNILEKNYPDKTIMLVEAGYPLYWKQDESKNEYELEYPLDTQTDTAQSQFTKDLVDLLLKHEKVNGLFWWWMEYNPYWSNLENWYNAPLVDPRTGKVTSAFATVASYATQIENNGSSGKEEEDKEEGGKDDNVDNGKDKPGTDVEQPGENPDDDKKDPGIDQPSNPSDDKKDPTEGDKTDTTPSDKPEDNKPTEDPKPSETPDTPGDTDKPGDDGDEIESPEVVNPDDKEENKDETDTPPTQDTPQGPGADEDGNIETPEGGETDESGNPITDPKPSDKPSQDEEEELPDQSEENQDPLPGDKPGDVLPDNPEDAGVNGILMDEEPIIYYDINGHAVKYPTKPGIYISKGKKFVIR